MLYTVEYKLAGAWFWRRLRRVKGDLILKENGNRCIYLEDETRVEIPKTAVVKFSRERFLSIQANMSKEAGQKIQVEGQP